MHEVRLEPFSAIESYAAIPIAFLVTSVLQPLPDASATSGFRLVEQPIERPFTKDYDAIPDNRPTDWGKHFDTAHWQLFSAFENGERVGGAIAFVGVSASATDARFAELWDLRVAPTYRRSGVATALFRAVEHWAAVERCATLRIETQHINVAACKFYERQGCTLHSVQAGAYQDFPDEIRLTWRRTLTVANS